jgi:hypothetical protein
MVASINNQSNHYKMEITEIEFGYRNISYMPPAHKHLSMIVY